MDVVVAELRKRGYHTVKTTISHYEHGRPPDLGILAGLADVYGVKFSVLCDLVIAELSGGIIPAAPAAGPTADGVTIARAYDEGPELLRTVLKGAVTLWRNTQGSDQPSHAPADDTGAEASGSHAPTRKSRRYR